MLGLTYDPWNLILSVCMITFSEVDYDIHIFFIMLGKLFFLCICLYCKNNIFLVHIAFLINSVVLVEFI